MSFFPIVAPSFMTTSSFCFNIIDIFLSPYLVALSSKMSNTCKKSCLGKRQSRAAALVIATSAAFFSNLLLTFIHAKHDIFLFFKLAEFLQSTLYLLQLLGVATNLVDTKAKAYGKGYQGETYYN